MLPFLRLLTWSVALATGGLVLCESPQNTCNMLNGAWAEEPLNAGTRFDQLSAPLVRTDLRLTNSASCAASACHGGSRPGVANPAASRVSEYPLWLQRDPHAQSWRTFCGEASVTILERLQIMQDGKIVDKPGYDNCLACHNSTRQFAEVRSAEHWREGVGCSNCHGPAEKWNLTHYQPNWNGLDAVSAGFVRAKDMLARARMCASCHVGDRDRDMNHDMIAAGHSPLYYEFATFHERQPKHWRDELEGDVSRYEAQQWLAGQLAALDASLVLLEARATERLPVSRWPEFAAYDCQACHQQLRFGEPAFHPVAAGSAEYSRWNRWGVEELLRLRRTQGEHTTLDGRLEVALIKLTSAMQSAAGSDAGKVKLAAREARLALDAWLGDAAGLEELRQFSAHRLRAVAISAGRHKPNLQTWETATQFYLASIAARHSWSKHVASGSSWAVAPPAQIEQLSSARELRDMLTFAKGTQSPQRHPLSSVWSRHLRAIEGVMLQSAEPMPLNQDSASPRFEPKN